MTLAAGTRVLVHYTGTLDDGTQFDSSRGREPLEVVLGQNMVIPGFEKAIAAMEPGQTVTVRIPEAEAYGPHNENMLVTFPRSSFPADIPAALGEQLILRSPEGHEVPALIVDVNETEISLDANHPLAGFDLTFEIELISVE
ncbi:FKBP-type peptidyl-prolyl cis-trans isomerase [Desulfomicrobium orale]|uniref:Peptidyl-prolyl cis-trans isomerase n=1 Tax=Desulfomicrobium orale DSM 12838 TaxID=888061 RepID=A0A109W6L0_9BACT|nr:peptidylprolyl isomerase [Desulfomicrobium orale]AMD93786.1 peptidylprolyl isomerase [Desulfomicrobium orale DSM 12838]